MPALKNPKHELFAQWRSEGKTADEAYVLARYKANSGNATRLNGKDSVLARVHELTDRRAKMGDVTLVAMTKRFNEAIEDASEAGSHPAVMAGLFNVAKLHGLIVDKQKLEQGRLDDMSDDALAEHIESRLARIAEGRAEGSGERSGGSRKTTEPEPDRELQPVSEADGIPRQGQDA